MCGENMFARHSIQYTALESYFYVFSVWDETNTALTWRDTEEWAALFGLPTPPVLYRGLYNRAEIRRLCAALDTERVEGVVVRSAGRIPYANFAQHVAKYVRPKHVQTDTHWMHAPVVPNGLKGGE